ncbi:MAG: hypothetical protein HND48_25405 [Chloroflexi bacterium]|nr:hypothetical protein [Chloroflexota bacterium]
MYRGERPQKGRYREFYQCDVDIVGVADVSADAEVLGVVVSTLRRLGFPNFTVKINNRKLLSAMGQYSGVPDAQLGDLYRSIDKFDKIGADGVRDELIQRGIDAEAVARMMALLVDNHLNADKLGILEDVMGGVDSAAEGIRGACAICLPI